jgi:hypothetical protein
VNDEELASDRASDILDEIRSVLRRAKKAGVLRDYKLEGDSDGSDYWGGELQLMLPRKADAK